MRRSRRGSRFERWRATQGMSRKGVLPAIARPSLRGWSKGTLPSTGPMPDPAPIYSCAIQPTTPKHLVRRNPLCRRALGSLSPKIDAPSRHPFRAAITAASPIEEMPLTPSAKPSIVSLPPIPTAPAWRLLCRRGPAFSWHPCRACPRRRPFSRATGRSDSGAHGFRACRSHPSCRRASIETSLITPMRGGTLFERWAMITSKPIPPKPDAHPFCCKATRGASPTPPVPSSTPPSRSGRNAVATHRRGARLDTHPRSHP